jgi:alpha-N-acetylglucosaminidase
LLRGFYKARWERFFAFLATQPPGYGEESLHRVFGRPGDESNPFYRTLSAWEYAWCDAHERYSPEPTGDPVAVGRRLLEKWRPSMDRLYPGFDWKPRPPKENP